MSSGCLDNIRCSDFEVMKQLSEKRNNVSAISSGILFAAGWWCMIDAAAVYPKSSQMPHSLHTFGVISTLGFIMINAFSNDQINNESYSTGFIGRKGAIVWLLIGYILSFGSLVGSLWILFELYIVPGDKANWPGIAMFLQNLFIFSASIIFKYGRTDNSY